jgi:hypothetical protein
MSTKFPRHFYKYGPTAGTNQSGMGGGQLTQFGPGGAGFPSLMSIIGPSHIGQPGGFNYPVLAKPCDHINDPKILFWLKADAILPSHLNGNVIIEGNSNGWPNSQDPNPPRGPASNNAAGYYPSWDAIDDVRFLPGFTQFGPTYELINGKPSARFQGRAFGGLPTTNPAYWTYADYIELSNNRTPAFFKDGASIFMAVRVNSPIQSATDDPVGSPPQPIVTYSRLSLFGAVLSAIMRDGSAINFQNMATKLMIYVDAAGIIRVRQAKWTLNYGGQITVAEINTGEPATDRFRVIAATWDPTTLSMKAYVDGTLKGEVQAPDPNEGVIIEDQKVGTLYIGGGHHFGDVGFYNANMNLFEYEYIRRAYSEAEIAQESCYLMEKWA